MADLDFDTLLHIEQTFYDSGYGSGYAHGKIHGVIEGRALGKEKGYEMWEEIAFYEAFAKSWDGLMKLSRNEGSSSGLYTSGQSGGIVDARKGEDRASQHIRHLLSLTAQFPVINPSTSSSTTESPSSSSSQLSDPTPEIDIPKLQRQIRSRYRALCSTIGVRPRFYTASDSNPDSRDGVEDELDNLGQDNGSQAQGDNSDGEGARMAATGARGKGFIPVWKVGAKGERKKVTNMDLSF